VPALSRDAAQAARTGHLADVTMYFGKLRSRRLAITGAAGVRGLGPDRLVEADISPANVHYRR
jgi:hypothetical protein